MRYAILLLLLISLSFAGEVWKVDAGSGVSQQPLVFGSRVIAETSAGKVYSIEPPFIKWTYNTESEIVSTPVSFGNHIIIPTSEKVIALDQYGSLLWEAPLPDIRAVAVSDKIYVADSNGIQALNSDGSLAWSFAPGMELENYNPNQDLNYYITEPFVNTNYVAFGYGNSLYLIRTNGQPLWNKDIGHVWDTAPLLVGSTIYVGTSEGIFYALDAFNGNELFRTNVFEQISTTPVLYGSSVLFGTSDNRVYSVSQTGVKWSVELEGKISSKMELAESPGALYLTTTKSLYAISPLDGAVLFKRSFLDWPSSPVYLNGQLVVGTEKGRIYGIDSSKACSILSPEADSQIGDMAITVSGLGYSSMGSPNTQFRVAGGAWESVPGTEWSYDLDPSQYPYGVIELECRVSGETEPYTGISLVHISNAEPSKMSITYPLYVAADTEFEISVVDSRGALIEGLRLTVGGEKIEGDGNITLSLPAGVYTIDVKRPGYQSEEFTIESKADSTSSYIAGGVFVIGLILYVYFFFIRKVKKKELIIKEKH